MLDQGRRSDGAPRTAVAAAALTDVWWQARPGLTSRLLQPLSLLYGFAASQRKRQARPQRAPVPVVIVGNWVVGGAGKTPTVIALVQALQTAGHRPGVVSRGFGRTGEQSQAVSADTGVREVGDEPLLIARRTGVPVWVGRARLSAARALCRAHPEVDVLVSDDGLQHHELARDAAVVVFDDRGVGNGLLLPAGPLREALPLQPPPQTWVLYTGTHQSTPLPGPIAERSAARIWLLQDWWCGLADEQGVESDTDAGTARGAALVADGTRPASHALSHLRGRPVVAMAGLGHPRKFFGMLERAGLQIEALPLPDHHPYDTLPWPAGTADIVTTEKDAIKLDPRRLGATPRIWVLPLDLQLPQALLADIQHALFGPATDRMLPSS